MPVTQVSAEIEQMDGTTQTLYTAPTTVEYSTITWANCTNEDTTDTNLTVYLVKQGGSAAVTNIYFPPKPIQAGKADPLDEIVGAALEPGDFIAAIAGAASRLNLKVGIKEVRA